MLEAEMKAQLGEYLTRLVTPVQITAYVDGSNDSREMLDLLDDVTSVSDKVTVTTSAEGGDAADAHVPRFALASPGQPARIAFAGLPMGHEFTSLVLALLQTGGYRAQARCIASSSRSGISTVISSSAPIFHFPARTARTWCRR